MPNVAELSRVQLEARSECLQIIETLLQGLGDGSLSTYSARLLVSVLKVHLQALGFERIALPATLKKRRRKS